MRKKTGRSSAASAEGAAFRTGPASPAFRSPLIPTKQENAKNAANNPVIGKRRLLFVRIIDIQARMIQTDGSPLRRSTV
jgi:hypothetical protein